MSKKKKDEGSMKLSYDEAIVELEQIMNQLQDDQVGLDKMASLVERAALLIKYCQEKLRGIQSKVEGIFEKGETD